MRLPPRQVIGIYGATGTGKTQGARAEIRDNLDQPQFRRRIYYDPACDYEEGVDAEIIVESREDFLDYVSDLEDTSQPFSIIYRPPAEDPEPEAAGFVARAAYALGNCVLILDEAHLACNAVNCSPHVLLLVKRGRHRGVSLIVISQRPNDVHPSIRAETFAYRTYVFRLARKDDLREIALERGSVFAESVARLPELHAYRITPYDTALVRIEFRPRPILVVESYSRGSFAARNWETRGN